MNNITTADLQKKKPTLYVTPSPNGMFKVEMKGDGVLLYKSHEELDELMSWNQYNVVFQEKSS